MPVRKEFSSLEAPCFSVISAEQVSVTEADQSMKFSGSSNFSSYNVGNSNISPIENLPSLSCFGSGSLSEIMDSFVFRQGTQMTSCLCPQGLPSTIAHGTEKNLKEKKRKMVPESGIQSNFPSVNHCVEELNVKENGDANTENYIHVQTKRGQGTNSHSIAERVRREKISERMKLLQDLVPGCNTITGKAVMLDEIINYVQSLQRQVEFLSMKLVAVNPEINLDMQQIFSIVMQSGMALPSLTSYRDILSTAINHQISPLVQFPNPWDFQNLIQLGLLPSIPHDVMDPTGNGTMKAEL